MNNDFLLGLANSFSAGIFLMLAFTQMIPHALDIFQNHQLDLSLAFKYSVVGYLVILSLEKILLEPSIWKASEDSPTGKQRTDSEIERSTQRNSSTSGLILVLAMSIHR